jgi:hypothetical protein
MRLISAIASASEQAPKKARYASSSCFDFASQRSAWQRFRRLRP